MIVGFILVRLNISQFKTSGIVNQGVLCSAEILIDLI